MVDLRAYYLENISNDDYYFRFHSFIKDINTTYDPFYGARENKNFEFKVYDEYEAIEKFQFFCQPNNEPIKSEDQCWFFLVAFYLNLPITPKSVHRSAEHRYTVPL